MGAIVYALTGGLFVGVLLFGLKQGLPETEVKRLNVVVGATVLFGVFAVIQYEMLSGVSERMELLVLGSSCVGLGMIIGFVSGDDSMSGLVHGIETGGMTALLLVLIAIQQSFSMRPALPWIVLWVLILGPPILGFIVGVGGAIGGSLHSIAPASMISD